MGALDAGSREPETRPPYFNGRELRTESIWAPRMPVPGVLKPDPHISTALSSATKVYGGQKVVKNDQRILTWLAIFCDFSRFSTRGHPLLTCPKHCVGQQKKKVAGMANVFRGQNRRVSTRNFIPFAYGVILFSNARFINVDWPTLPGAAPGTTPLIPGAEPGYTRRTPG